MAKKATKAVTPPKAALTLTVHVEFHHPHAERWFRDYLRPSAALAGALAQSIAAQVADVRRITVCDRARQNISPFFEFTRRG